MEEKSRWNLRRRQRKKKNNGEQWKAWMKADVRIEAENEKNMAKQRRRRRRRPIHQRLVNMISLK